MSQNQNAQQHSNINKSFERVEQLIYMKTTPTNQNPIHEEIKSRLKRGNACCHSVQNLLYSTLLSKNVKIKTYRTIISPVLLHGCDTLSRILRQECTCAEEFRE
jgi:hypothetical protein